MTLTTPPPSPASAVSASIARFPFPFPKDQYRYSTNVEPAGAPNSTVAGEWGDSQVVIDEHFDHEMAERARVLAADPSRIQVLPHMVPAAWDAMFAIMTELASAYPEWMTLERVGGGAGGAVRWHWVNTRAGFDDEFVLGDASTLPSEPLDYIGQQVQEDIVLLDQREGELWGDAGLVTFAADWSMGFDVGMTFLEIHGPVPRVHAESIIPRAQAFLMRLEPGQSYRRTNWTLTVDGKLDTATETYTEWGKDRKSLAEGPLADVGSRLFLRTEVQHLIRLPTSGCIMFLIRTYMLSFAEVATIPEWSDRLYRVLGDLPDDMVDYKGLTRTRPPAMAWLTTHGGVTP